MSTKIAVAEDLEPWRQLVRLEFRDLPMMRLTLSQACRLWGLELDLGRKVLDSLIESHDLALVGGRYCLAGCLDGISSFD